MHAAAPQSLGTEQLGARMRHMHAAVDICCPAWARVLQAPRVAGAHAAAAQSLSAAQLSAHLPRRRRCHRGPAYARVPLLSEQRILVAAACKADRCRPT